MSIARLGIQGIRNCRSVFGLCTSAIRLVSVLLGVLSAISPQSKVFAAGDEYSRQAADLVLTVDSRWAGCGYGGYYPIRIKVANRGVERSLRFRYSPQYAEGLPTVERSLHLAQNATARLTLSVPCVGNGTYGILNVYQNGRLIDALSQGLTVPDNQSYSTPRPALLIISSAIEDAAGFETAVTSLHNMTHSGSHGYAYYGYASENHQVIGPELLPTSWVEYSGLDLVAISLKTLASLAADERAAILKWTHCGGTLIVYGADVPPSSSADVTRLLEMDTHATADEPWESADPTLREIITVTETDEFGNIVIEAEARDDPESALDELAAGDAADFVWPGSADTFARRSLLMGTVYVFSGNPFGGTPHDWAWFLRSLPRERQNWPERHGIAARRGSDEFLKFLIPSVKGVPVAAFLLLITLFTVLIGPLNYFWLWKKRQLALLVVTIPAIAFGTTLSLFAYSAMAHGFSTRSRARTLTLVDQASNTAVSMGRISLFSGLAPSGGLQFSPETAVYPIWRNGESFDSGGVDWTERQKLAGWLRSRTRTQFLTVAHRDERGRLRVSPRGDERITIDNGFEWTLESIIVSDNEGNLFYGRDIPAGGSIELNPISDEQRLEFVRLIQQQTLRAPASQGRRGGIFDWGFAPYAFPNAEVQFAYHKGLLEQQLQKLQRISRSSEGMGPNAYAAVVDGNPGIEFGVTGTREEDSLHVLMGRY